MLDKTFTYKDTVYDLTHTSENMKHGGPFDRGSADSYYRRGIDVHWWPLGTNKGYRIEIFEMSDDEIKAYHAGYEYNEMLGEYKDWG